MKTYESGKDGHTYWMENGELWAAPTLLAGGYDDDCKLLVKDFAEPLTKKELQAIHKALATTEYEATMLELATINVDDDENGEQITIGAVAAEYDGETGWRLASSIGDEVGYYRPHSLKECEEEIQAMWGHWATLHWIN